jgi:hypothetical protein
MSSVTEVASGLTETVLGLGGLVDKAAFCGETRLNLTLWSSSHSSMFLEPFSRLWPDDQVLSPTHRQWDSLHGGSARRKASLYQNTGIRTSSGITAPAFEMAESSGLQPEVRDAWGVHEDFLGSM